MGKNRATLEIIAPTIEEAIAKGLGELGLSEDAVEIEVLDEGTRGIFGLGSRQARVRISIKPGNETSTKAGKQPIQHLVGDEDKLDDLDYQEEITSGEDDDTFAEEDDQDEDLVLRIAQDTVYDLLERMKVDAEIHAYYGEPDDLHTREPVCVDIVGNDLSILIGRQAETLNAFQYIAGLIAGKELGHRITLIIDVEGYRKRREQQLRKLARRMADQALKTGRRQILEPMPANERRIIHIELRDIPEVTTESIGEAPRRKVTIIPR